MATISRAGRRATAATLCLACVVATGCSPTLDWRTVRPDGGAIELLFPCRPTHDARHVRLDGVDTAMRMDACHADGATFSLAAADASDASRVAPLLRALRAAAIANIDGAVSELPFVVPRATPNALSARLRIAGHRADRRPVIEEVVFFVRGARVYQATLLGESSQTEAADVFFGSIKASP